MRLVADGIVTGVLGVLLVVHFSTGREFIPGPKLAAAGGGSEIRVEVVAALMAILLIYVGAGFVARVVDQIRSR